ncbi:unnamed protein product [Boreogadus saida]
MRTRETVQFVTSTHQNHRAFRLGRPPCSSGPRLQRPGRMMLSPDPAVEEEDLSWGDLPPRCLLDPLRSGRGPGRGPGGAPGAAAGEEGPGHARSLSLSREERRRRRRTTARYRSAHASRERVRVEAFNGAFGDLRDLLPVLPPDKKLSKIEILRLAMCYISYLSHVLEL